MNWPHFVCVTPKNREKHVSAKCGEEKDCKQINKQWIGSQGCKKFWNKCIGFVDVLWKEMCSADLLGFKGRQCFVEKHWLCLKEKKKQKKKENPQAMLKLHISSISMKRV